MLCTDGLGGSDNSDHVRSDVSVDFALDPRKIVHELPFEFLIAEFLNDYAAVNEAIMIHEVMLCDAQADLAGKRVGPALDVGSDVGVDLEQKRLTSCERSQEEVLGLWGIYKVAV